MGKGGSAPKAPDPQQTAQAQTSSNVDTAIAQSQLNAINQVTPYGNLTYTQTYPNQPSGGSSPVAGSPSGPMTGGIGVPINARQSFTNPNGGSSPQPSTSPQVGGSGSSAQSRIPQWTATQTLSPSQQAIFDQSQGAQLNLATVANEQSGRLGDLLNEPFSLDNDATESRLMELGRKRLDPLLEDRRTALNTSLTNRGIRPGSTQWNKAMDASMQGENDAYNQLLLGGRNQSIQEALLQRQTPLNEMIALSSGSQIQSPNFVGTPQTGVAGTDVAGITQNAYGNQMNAYNQQQQQNQSMMGGLFGLGANALMAFSDERLKENIKKVGKTDKGDNLYLYNYKGNSTPQVGVMAQEIEKTNPDAVVTDPKSGYKMVNYAEAV